MRGGAYNQHIYPTSLLKVNLSIKGNRRQRYLLSIFLKDWLFDLYLNLKQWYRINKFSISSKLVDCAYSLSLFFMGFIITAIFIDFNHIVLKNDSC